MNFFKLFGSNKENKEEPKPYSHPDQNITDFILRELLSFEDRVKKEGYCPPSSELYPTHESFVADLDILITTFSLLRTNSNNFKIYSDQSVQKGLILFIRMYKYLSFLNSTELVTIPKAAEVETSGK